MNSNLVNNSSRESSCFAATTRAGKSVLIPERLTRLLAEGDPIVVLDYPKLAAKRPRKWAKKRAQRRYKRRQ